MRSVKASGLSSALCTLITERIYVILAMAFWVVFLTEWCTKVAMTLLWETYDCWRLWNLPPQLISLMRRLDYSVPIGGADADAELHSLLDKIENVDWDSVPRQNSSRSFIRQRPSFSAGRSHRGAGDYAGFNTWTGSQCSCEEARLSRQYGSQTPVPVEMPVFSVDLRERDFCPREPLRSRPVSPLSPTSLPADTAALTLPVSAPMRATGDPVRIGSKSPFRSY